MAYPLATTTDSVAQVNGATALAPWVGIPCRPQPGAGLSGQPRRRQPAHHAASLECGSRDSHRRSL